jgi:hypothetical protein
VGNCKVNFQKFIDMKVTAPEEPGTYTYEYRMGSETDGLFGDTFSLTIIVKDEKVLKEMEKQSSLEE